MKAIGSFSLIRQAKPRSRWKVDGKPEYDPNWIVRFFVGQPQPLQKTAKLYRICDRCLEAKNPAKDRPNCACIQAVSRWANEFLKAQTALLRAGELERLRELTAPRTFAKLPEVINCYLKRGPKDRRQRVNSLRSMFTQATGRKFELVKRCEDLEVDTDMNWPDLTRALALDWAELRQEAGRRGWLGLGAGKNMPADGWATLRGLKMAGKLPALDKRQAEPWNTTIGQYLTNVKSMFGEESRQHVLRGLELPDLSDLLETVLDLPTPKGHKAIDAKRWEAMLDAEDGLKREDLRLWVVHELLLRLSCRPIEVVAARPSWLETVEGRTRIVITNRRDEGFTLKAGAGGRERAIWLPGPLVEAIHQVSTETSLIGARHATEAKTLVYDLHSKWMRRFVPEGATQTNYLLRHSGAAERMTSGNATKAAALLGHSTTALVETTYGRYLETLEPVTDDEILRRVS